MKYNYSLQVRYLPRQYTQLTIKKQDKSLLLVILTQELLVSPRNSNYQKFYPTTFPSLLDPKVGQPSGWVSKDGMWAAVPSNGRKFAIIHNGIVEHFSKNFECAMIYIKKGIQKEKKNARSKLNRQK